MKTAIRVVFLCSICILLIAQDKGAKAVADKDGLGVLVLPNGSTFKTTLYHLKVIGELRTTAKLPYYVLSGTGCIECDANRSIYIHSPSDGPMKGEAGQQRFLYPGREANYESGRVVYEARAFFSHCVASYPNAVVWFERSVGEDRQWHSGVFVAEVKSDNLVVRRLQRNLPTLDEALKSIKSGECKEIPGVNRLSEP